MTWKVPRMWDEGECWIIGGGPSLPRQFSVPEEVINQVTTRQKSPSAYSPYMKAIHSKHVIGVNAAYTLGTWIDLVIMGDRGFYLSHRQRLAEFPGIKVSCNPGHAGLQKENIKYLQRDKKRFGISDFPQCVCWNGNTGAAAISIAANAGVHRIILLGFDMRLTNDRQHWHSLYGSAHRPMDKNRLMHLPFDRHLKCFPDIARDAKRRGIEILNACPDSAIECFKKVTVKELL